MIDFWRPKLNNNHHIHFWQSLLMLMQSGMNLHKAIQSLQYTETHPILKSVLYELDKRLQQGQTLSQSLSPFVPNMIDRLSWQLIQVGEQSGRLENIIEDIIALKQRRYQLNQQLRQALTYPLLTLSAGLIIVALLIMVVLPQFKQFYASLGHSLPRLTQYLIVAANILAHYGWLIITIFVILSFSLWHGLQYYTPVRHYFFQIILRIPLIGSSLYYQNLVYSWRHLQLLINAGLPVDRALNIIKQTTIIPYYRALFELAARQIQTGQKLSVVFHHTQLLTPIMHHLLEVGEQSGQLETALKLMTQHCNQQLDQRLHRLQHSLGPAIMLIISLIVAFIMIAMYLPMFSMGQAL